MGRSLRSSSRSFRFSKIFSSLAVAVVAVAPGASAMAASPAVIRTLEEASPTRIEIAAAGSRGAWSARPGVLPARGEGGARVYFDLRPAVLTEGLQAPSRLSHPSVHALRVGQFDPRTVRVVLQLDADVDPTGFAAWRNGALELRPPAVSLDEPSVNDVDLDAIAADVRAEFGKVVLSKKQSSSVASASRTPATRPAAAASTDKRPARKLTVVIDPGHGGKDTGALGVRGATEKDVNLRIARRLEKRLRAKGFRVVLTRTKDRYLSLEARVARAHKAKADLVLSIHANGHRDRKIHGVETFHAGKDASSDSRRLAKLIQQGLVRALKGRRASVRDLGVKHARFFVLRNTRMPAVLVETGFITHPKEGAALSKATYRDAVAGALARAVERYAGPATSSPKTLALRGASR